MNRQYRESYKTWMYNNPNPLNTEEERVQQALLFHSWNWSNKDCYEKAGIGRKKFTK